ncbi:MAG: hypothetical protein MI867_25825, partial [Pseudomonadales bacterium]|nr:hypothetical protein [Pseudomonadales bacterium]
TIRALLLGAQYSISTTARNMVMRIETRAAVGTIATHGADDTAGSVAASWTETERWRGGL